MPSKNGTNQRLRVTRHPLVYEVNTRILLRELSAEERTPVTLGTIPDRILEEWASLGFDAVWMMGVWATGSVGREIARSHPALQEEFHRALPDLTPDDIQGSPYAVSAFAVPKEFGGSSGLRTLRTRLGRLGIGLILDFICNHTARDHGWVSEHPEFYVQGREDDDRVLPDLFFRAATKEGERVIAHGKDPLFPAWTDTAQLNIMHPGLRSALIAQLRDIAGRCDGVRCDMAMLVLNDVFWQTWGAMVRRPDGAGADREFWSEALKTIRETAKDFLFIAEAYWDREWDLQQLGFDATYDKRLYDRLRHEGASSVRDHLTAAIEFQNKSLRFIENHDEPRAGGAFPGDAWHYAAAVAMSTVPGGVLFHEGQLDGRTAKLPVQLVRRPVEPRSAFVRAFYERLLKCLASPAIRQGKWTMLEVHPSWHDNPTSQNFLAFWWAYEGNGDRLVVINYAPHSGQGYVQLPFREPAGSSLEFRDLMGEAVFVRDSAGLQSRGMFFDLPGYGFHFFEVSSVQR